MPSRQTFQDPAYHQLDPDVTAALILIRRTLPVDIRGALNKDHCYDQSEPHTRLSASSDASSASKKEMRAAVIVAMVWSGRNAVTAFW